MCSFIFAHHYLPTFMGRSGDDVRLQTHFPQTASSSTPRPLDPSYHLPFSLISAAEDAEIATCLRSWTTSGPRAVVQCLRIRIVIRTQVFFCFFFLFLSAVPVEPGCQFSSSFITPSHYSLISFPSLFGTFCTKQSASS